MKQKSEAIAGDSNNKINPIKQVINNIKTLAYQAGILIIIITVNILAIAAIFAQRILLLLIPKKHIIKTFKAFNQKNLNVAIILIGFLLVITGAYLIVKNGN